MAVKWYRFTNNSKKCIDALERGSRAATENFVEDITKLAVSYAPSDQDLKRSISTEQNMGRQFKVLGAKSPREYANFSVNVPRHEVEKDGHSYSMMFGAYAPWAMDKEYGDVSEGRIAQPFMRPAIDEVASSGDKRLAASIRRELDKHHELKE